MPTGGHDASGSRKQPESRDSQPKSGFLGDIASDRRIRWILAIYLLVVFGIVGYTARATYRQRGSALIVNIAARQKALAERYVKDVLLVNQGSQADPDDDAQQLLANAHALLAGGQVVAVQGADQEIVIPPASAEALVVSKLQEEQRLITSLVKTGDQIMETSPGANETAAQLQELRIAGALVSSVSNDAVGQMTRDSEASFSRLIGIGIGLGMLGAIAAIAMGLLMRRVGIRRSARFQSLVHNASDLITVVDEDSIIHYQSPSAERMVGIPSERMVGQAFRDFVHPDDREYLDALLGRAASRPGAVATGGFRTVHVDGSFRHVDTIVSNLLNDPTTGGLVLNTRDITYRKQLEQELEQQAFFDSLTGLSNRAVFRDRLDHALTRTARGGHHELAVLLLDLDGFKLVNDSLGHDAGDELLVAVGRRIQECTRETDTVARLGGDEFVILMEEDVNESRGLALANRLLEQLRSPFELRGREMFIGASVGLAVDVGGTSKTEELIRNADTAMYAAKNSGKGRCEVFRPAMHQRAVEFFEVQADLQVALGRGEFLLHYQPIVDMESGRIEGVEALARWLHPTRGLLMPISFIPVAEETGMIVPLGVWVLGEACRQTAAWQRLHPAAANMWVSVNLSTRQLFEPDLVERVADVLSESGLDPSALILEITEGSLMQDVTQTAAKLRGLKELGCPARARRLRDRILGARLPADVPGRPVEDRQVVRRRAGRHRLRGIGARSRDHRARGDAASSHRRRGDRTGRPAGRAPLGGM